MAQTATSVAASANVPDLSAVKPTFLHSSVGGAYMTLGLHSEQSGALSDEDLEAEATV